MPFSPEQMLIAVAAAGTAIAIVALIVTRVLSSRQTETSPSPAPAKIATQANGTTGQPAKPQSYTAIAVAAAANAAKPPAHAEPPVRIDYSNALAGIRPDASYAAIAVAAAAQNG